MRHLRRTVLAALALALYAAPIAVADEQHRHGGGAVIAPARGGGLTGGELLGESWARASYSNAPNPLSGSCLTVARNVLQPQFDEDLTARCTATQSTRLFLRFGTACFNVEEGVGETEQEQLECAVTDDQEIDEINITVDGGETTNLVRRRFELFSRQRTVELPENNVFDIPAQAVTFTAHAWGAVVRRLRPGQHIITYQVVAFGESFPPETIILNVLRGGRHGEDNHD